MAGSFLMDDLDQLFASADFAEAGGSVTWKGSTVTGIFDKDDVEVQMGEGVAEIVAQPMFTGKAADFLGIASGDTMVIRGVTYKVKNWKVESDLIEIYIA